MRHCAPHGDFSMCALIYLDPGVGRGSNGKAQTKHHAWSFRDDTHQIEGDGQVGSAVR